MKSSRSSTESRSCWKFSGHPLIGAEAAYAHFAGAGADGDGFAAGADGAVAGCAQGQGQRGAAVGVAVGAVRGAVGDLAGGTADAVDGMQVFADHAVDRHAQAALFKGHAQLGKNLKLERIGEMAEFDLAEFVPGRVPLAEFLDQIISQADARTGVIQTDAARLAQTRSQPLDLFRRGHAIHLQDFHGVLNVTQWAQGPSHGQVVLASEIDAHEQRRGGCAQPEFVGHAGGGFHAFARSDQFVREQRCLNIEELALELLRPAFRIVQRFFELPLVDGQALVRGSVDVNKMAGPNGRRISYRR